MIREPPPPPDHGAVAHSHRHSHKLHNSAFPLPFVWKRLTSKSTHARPTHSGARSSGKGSEYSCTGSVLQLGLLHHLLVKGLQSGLCGTLGRKPGVKDILRAEIASCCWEHEQAVRVSFTHHGSSVYACCCPVKTCTKCSSSLLVLTVEAANAVRAGLPGPGTSGGRRHLAGRRRLVPVGTVSGRPNSPLTYQTVKRGALGAVKRLI